jgi:uncharacterized BrkB/YihY/UPF0761 family membrane protein
MQTQERRDEKTLAISTAIGLFVLTLAVGSLALWVSSSTLDWSDHLTSALFTVICCTAGVVAIVYLTRVSKP